MKKVKFEVYYGTDIKGISIVTPEAWECFKIDHIDPLFDSYSVRVDTGRWKGTNEVTYVLERLADTGVEAALVGHKMASIAEIYKTGFGQDCVLMVKTDVEGYFI